MQLEIIGPHPFEQDERGRQKAHIGTLFPGYNTLCTLSPGVHACQRLSFIQRVNLQRAEGGQPPLSPEQEELLSAHSIDLVFEPNLVLIRPDPKRMDLAFAADELLQLLVSKKQIRFLSVSDERVRQAIKRRGENWRLSSLPKTREAKHRWIFGSKVAINGLPIYFYNRLTGTRWLTYQEFESLGTLEPTNLGRHLDEIAEYSRRRNRLSEPELDFFAADLGPFSAADLAGPPCAGLTPEQLRARFEELKERFRSRVHEGLRKDDSQNNAWCERMLSTLFLKGNEAETEQITSDLGPEFFLRIEWLPGGRFEEGEFISDPLFDEAARHPEDAELQRLCDPRAKGIIFNLLREYGDLEFINVGYLPESLSLNRPQRFGRRVVYFTEFKSRSDPELLRRFVRLQKWGIWEHLDEGKDLLQAINASEEYTDYWLDRRLGCHQLGMNVTRRVILRRLSEIYEGSNPRYRGQMIRTSYFEREYLPGIASDKLPLERYSRPGYAAKLAVLLGRAAAPSLIVGRELSEAARLIFDDGDELIREGEDGLPAEILVADHSGAFSEYLLPLEAAATHYARPVNSRDRVLPDPKGFAEAYLDAFREHFLHIQGDYRKRRRAFDTLFKGCKYDPAGSFAYRWERVLQRLDQTDVDALVAAIRSHIRVLNPANPQPRPAPANPPR